MKKTRVLPVVGNLVVLAAGLAVLFGLPAFAETYLIINSTIFAAFAILALSLALIWGYAGILCFGQAAFFGLGGYVLAMHLKLAALWGPPRHQPAFFDRAAARAGFSAFFGASLTVSLAARLPLPLIGSSISRWPLAALRGFLPLLFSTAGAACFSLARLRFSASIRLMTLPPVFGAAFAVVFRPLRFWLIKSISACS